MFPGFAKTWLLICHSASVAVFVFILVRARRAPAGLPVVNRMMTETMVSRAWTNLLWNAAMILVIWLLLSPADISRTALVLWPALVALLTSIPFACYRTVSADWTEFKTKKEGACATTP